MSLLDYVHRERGSSMRCPTASTKAHHALVLGGHSWRATNPRDFQEEVQAFFHEEDPVEFTWSELIDNLTLNNGREYPVKIYGYTEDDRAQAYFQQKCQFELYQAIHRIRPYIRDEELYIYVFTNMPIPGVKVEGLMGATAERRENALRILEEHLIENGGCTVPEFASMIEDGFTSVGSAKKWVQREAQRLANIMGCGFEPGCGGRPGQFVSG